MPTCLGGTLLSHAVGHEFMKMLLNGAFSAAALLLGLVLIGGTGFFAFTSFQALGRHCASPQSVTVSSTLHWTPVPGTVAAVNADVSGTYQNTCTYGVHVTLELQALSSGGTVLASANTMPDTLAPGEARTFARPLGLRDTRDIASVRALPRVTPDLAECVLTVVGQSCPFL